MDPLDIVGVKYKTLEVLEYLVDLSISGKHLYKCLCQGCGKEYIRPRRCITKQRGCKTCINTKHNLSRSTEYCSWRSMKCRCYVETNPGYKDYGGRGIEVSDKWLNSFEEFYEDMGSKPSKDHSLDRINVDGNYEPGNCRWATSKEQARNKRTNVLNKELAEEIRRLNTEENLKSRGIAKKLSLKLGTVSSVLNNENWID